ncbi:MAG: hypothetical protein VKK97_03740 [Synechococcaceae cyanobacterium]|nr:hypothetical protein [Synechococcaceae cyanobacterium]
MTVLPGETHTAQHGESAMLNTSHFSSPSSSAKGSKSTSRRPRWSSLAASALAKSALFSGVVIGVIGAGQAHALVVNVAGQWWDVTTFTGSYNDNTNKFRTPNNGGVMPWWGEVTVAAAWADALGWALGDTNTGQWDDPQNLRAGPAFAWSIGNHPINNDEIVSFRYVFAQPASSYPNYLVAPPHMGDLRSRSTITWVQATAPVPSPLPALGATAAFGFSRQPRRRIKRITNAVSSRYSR